MWKLAAYIVATVRITNPQDFALYVGAIAGLSERYGGVYLLRGAVSEVLEGDSPLDERVVILQFGTAETAKAYIQSDEYQAAARLRAGAAEVRIRLLVDAA